METLYLALPKLSRFAAKLTKYAMYILSKHNFNNNLRIRIMMTGIMLCTPVEGEMIMYATNRYLVNFRKV
jgi:hypothetical protein